MNTKEEPINTARLSPVLGLELLQVLLAVVDQPEARRVPTTEVRLEAVEDNIGLIGLVELGDVCAELLLGYRRLAGVKDVDNLHGKQHNVGSRRRSRRLIGVRAAPFASFRAADCGAPCGCGQ